MADSPGTSPDHRCDACTVPARIAAKPWLRDSVLRNGIVELLLKHHASEIDQILLALSSGDDLIGSKVRPSVIDWLVTFVRRGTEVDLRPLVSAAVAGGLLRAQPTLIQLNLPSWWSYDTDHILQLATARAPKPQRELWRHLGILAALPSWNNTERIGLRAEVMRLAEAHPGIWARSLPWLLLVGNKLGGLDIAVTVALARTQEVVARAVDTSAANPVAQVSLRAAGARILMQHDLGDSEPWLLDTLASTVDRRRDVFPRPLAGPAASWLADADLESLIRGSARLAQREFADVVRDQGAAEEEGLTQQLLAALAKHFDRINHVVQVSGARKAPAQISLAQRTVPKHEEKTIGADLGIVVHAELPGVLTVRFGDLVQVKKTLLLSSPQLRSESWRIEVEQLTTLLGYSATAAYWLIQQRGDVLVVPAKLLMALHEGRSAPRPATFTARYSDIRHACIPLEQHLLDLTLGMWTGSSAMDTLSVADGSHGRTRPRHILEITVRRADG